MPALDDWHDRQTTESEALAAAPPPAPVTHAASGGPVTGPGPGSYGQGMNYGGIANETQGEVNRASEMAFQRAKGLFAGGTQNAGIAAKAAGRADQSGGMYQQQGAQDFGNQLQDRGATQDALGRLRGFYEQGPGPSAAEAQMRAGQDANMGQAIALAHSGRGAGANANAMRQAAFSNAASGQQMNQQLGVLRANEGQAWRQQQLGAMGLEQGTLGTMRGQDISSMGANAQSGLGYGQLGQAYTQTGMTNQLGFSQLGSGQQMEGERLRQQILSGQLGANVQMRGQDTGFNTARYGGGDDSNAATYGAIGAVAGGIAGSIIPGVGTVGGAALGGAVGGAAGSSDIRAKKGIRTEDIVGALRQFGSGDKKPGEPPTATPENPTARPEPAPWEMGVSPFAQQQGPQAFGQDPRNQQQVVPLDFGAPPGGVYGSDERSKQNVYQMGLQHGATYGGPPPGAQGQMQAQRAPQAQGQMLGRSVDGYAQGPGQGGYGPGGGMADAARGLMASDKEAKEKVRQETLRDVFSHAPTAALDAAYARQTADTGPRTDLRPAQGYSYEYKDPSSPGAAPGRHYGPMAQDLLKTPAGASTVVHQPNGRLGVDTGRLSLVNTSAISDQQNQLDRLRAMLDQGQARQASDVGSRFGGMR